MKTIIHFITGAKMEAISNSQSERSKILQLIGQSVFYLQGL